MRSTCLAIGLAVVLFGCSSAPSTLTPTNDASVAETGTTTTLGLPCDVDAVFARSCRQCHGATPAFGAPMSLVSHGDLMAASPSEPGKKIFETVRDRVHRTNEQPGRMPQKPNAPLSSTDLASIDGWIASGAKSSIETCGGAPPDGGVVSTLSCKPDVSVRAKSKFAMPKDATDLYVCYGFDQDLASKRHITGIAPRINNSKIVHHVLLMQADATYGDGTPAPCEENGVARMRMLYAWAPGVGSFELPAAAGLPAEKGKTHYVVQIHYNNLKALEGETDESGFEFCSTDALRPNDADVLAFGTLKIDIPAKSKHDVTATLLVPATMPELHVVGSFPHMHQAGRSIATTLHRAGDAAAIDLGTALPFEFGNQFFNAIPDVIVKSGDTVKTRCVWENTTDVAIKRGEKTSDEMCFSFTMYYPKITNAGWVWGLPAFLAKTTVN